MAKKKTVIKVVVSGLVVVFIAAAVMLASIHGAFKTVEKPEIKEGEFEFALTYEVDGESKVIEGTYVCEFDGITRAIDGVGRHWKGYIKGHEDFTDYEIKTTDEGVIKVDLDICADFFMSDPNYQNMKSSDDPKPEPYIYITSDDSADDVIYALYEGDDVKIISFEYDEPIENEYK